MGNCRIQNIKPPCGYQVEGIELIQLLDFDDFNGFKFDGDGLYSNCLVTFILRSGDFVELDTPDSANYTSTLQNGIYNHKLETFIGDLSANLEATLHLSTKRRYIVLFRAKNGRFFSFAYESGANVNYTNQTADGIGSLVTVTSSSIYPLFEVSKDAFEQNFQIAEFIPDFEMGAYCELS